jgi:hypothetical protein
MSCRFWCKVVFVVDSKIGMSGKVVVGLNGSRTGPECVSFLSKFRNQK